MAMRCGSCRGLSLLVVQQCFPQELANETKFLADILKSIQDANMDAREVWIS